MIGHCDLLHPHVVDEPVTHDRARRFIVEPDRGCQEELSVEVSALVEAQQLERRVADTQHPARDKARVLGEETVLAALIGTYVAVAIAHDERAPVENTQGALRHVRTSWQGTGAPRSDTCP